MTDLEKFIDCYKQFGIELLTSREDGKIIIYVGGRQKLADARFHGISIVEFTEEGSFIEQLFWSN